MPTIFSNTTFVDQTIAYTGQPDQFVTIAALDSAFQSSGGAIHIALAGPRLSHPSGPTSMALDLRLLIDGTPVSTTRIGNGQALNLSAATSVLGSGPHELKLQAVSVLLAGPPIAVQLSGPATLTVEETPAARTAIVLSGGGARGDFEVGAVRYLYETGIRPAVLCGTSVGAINALKLAEGENLTHVHRGLEGLTAIWAGLQTDSDMYWDEAWLSDADMDARIADYLRGYRDDLGIEAPGEGGPWGILQAIVDCANQFGFLVGDGAQLLKSLGVIMTKARGLYNLQPVVDRLNSNFNRDFMREWVAAGNKLRLAVVGLESGRLRYVTESGHLIERDGAPVYDPDATAPQCQLMADALLAVQAEIEALRGERTTAQEDLRAAEPGAKALIAARIKGLNSQLQGRIAQAAAKRRELSACAQQNPVPFQLQDIRRGALASASIPGVFLPVRIGSEYYVDGGIREVIPVQAAVDAGATTIYAISASSRNVSPFATPVAAGLLEIVGRSLTEIAIDEISRTDRLLDAPAGLPLPAIFHIEPAIDLHDITTIDPGLIKISQDYGYMRAADTLAAATGDRRGDLATLIAQLRLEIWRLENAAAGQRDPTRKSHTPTLANPALIDPINQKKQELAALITERTTLGAAMPSDIAHWIAHFELHPWRHPPENDAAFVGQVVPDTIAQGAMAAVSVTMRNTGSVTWQASLGYQLGSQNPPDNQTWGTYRVALPNDVAPSAEVTFQFNISAPPVGGAIFQWRLVQTSAGWFGEPSAAVSILATSPQEPAICDVLRQQLANMQAQIQALEENLSGDVRADAGIRSAVLRLRQQVANLRQQAAANGCAV